MISTEAKEYLGQIDFLDRLIQNKQFEVYQLKCLATNVTAPMGTEPVQNSNVSDKVGNITAKIVDLEIEINGLIDQYIDEKQKRITLIEQIDDPLQYSILHKKYIQRKSLTEIAEEEHFSYVWVNKNHGYALKKIQNFLNCI